MRIDELRFLVVDDHGFQRWAVSNILTSLGATQVYMADDGAAAIDTFRRVSPPVDIIVTDLDMPGMDGMQLIRRLANEGCTASLIVASGLDRRMLTTVKTMGDAYGVPVVAVIEKPASPRALREAIERHFARAANPAGTPSLTAVEVAGALREDEIEPRFAPRVDIASRAVVAAQAAPFWVEPDGRVTSTDAFVDIARAAGLMPLMGWRLLRKAVTACAEWRGAGVRLGVCVPIGAESLRDASYAERVQGCGAAVGLPPAAITLQFDAFPNEDGFAIALENISRLRMLGFGVALPYGPRLRHPEELLRAPCDELSLDIAAARALDEGGRAAMAAAADAARSSGIAVSALGIASREEWELAVGLGAQTATGPGLTAPLSASAFAEEIARRPAWRGFR